MLALVANILLLPARHSHGLPVARMAMATASDTPPAAHSTVHLILVANVLLVTRYKTHYTLPLVPPPAHAIQWPLATAIHGRRTVRQDMATDRPTPR